jgi:hypothetical protein
MQVGPAFVGRQESIGPAMLFVTPLMSFALKRYRVFTLRTA